MKTHGQCSRTFKEERIFFLFLDMNLKTRKTTMKINKWGNIKLKIFCTAKETINRMKRQPTE
jgi:hypothetical protein